MSEEVSVFKKSQKFSSVGIISDLNGEQIVKTFYSKELQKTNQKESGAEKVIKRKGNKLCVKWKRYDSSFNSWVDKKNII